MCVYCYCGDHAFRWNPPWQETRTPDELYPWHPLVPKPATPGPHLPWSIKQLKEYMKLLKEIKKLEDKLGCPCEPNKADYLSLLKKRIKALEKRAVAEE